MGVQSIHLYVKQRAQDKVFNQQLNAYLGTSQRDNDKIRVIIDGNNFGFVLLRESQSPGCFGGEPKVYEELFKKFMEKNLGCCEEVLFVIGNSLTAGTREWANRRQKEQMKAKELFEKMENGKSPHSLGQYGRNGMRSYPDGFHPPWLVHQIAETAASVEKVKVYQSECDKDYAIMKLACQYKCPIISSDSDFLLYAVSPVIRCDFNWHSGAALIYEQNWYHASGIRLRSYHLPLLSALSFNAECDLYKEDLEPFWEGLTRGDTTIPIVAHVAAWLSRDIDEEKLKQIGNLTGMIDEIGRAAKTSKSHQIYFNDLKRRDRFIRSVKRFMVPDRSPYPWEGDPHFNIGEHLVKDRAGSHPLPRSAKSSPEFSKLNAEVKSVIIKQRDRILNSPLPIPLLTENVLHLYNSIHPGPKKKLAETNEEHDDEHDDDLPEYDDDLTAADTALSARPKRERELPVVSNLLRKYLKRELFILELDDAEFYRFKEGVSDSRYMYTIIDQEIKFNYLSKSAVQPIYNLYQSNKEEKIRTFLACFDSEILMYIDKNITGKPAFIIVFLACLRYLWKQTKMKSWELDAFVAQFALLDIFTSETKHFGRLKWLVTGGTETSPVELPACERSIILSNLFSSVYYATMRARVVCGQPWENDDRPPVFKDIFSGGVFACCYRILKENPEYRASGKQACGLDDQRWIGIDRLSKNEAERNCYYKAASIYDAFKSEYINAFAKFDERVRQEKRKMRAAGLKDQENKSRQDRDREKGLRDLERGMEDSLDDRDFSSILFNKAKKEKEAKKETSSEQGHSRPVSSEQMSQQELIERLAETNVSDPRDDDVSNIEEIEAARDDVRPLHPAEPSYDHAESIMPSRPPAKVKEEVNMDDIFDQIKGDEGKTFCAPNEQNQQPVDHEDLEQWKDKDMGLSRAPARPKATDQPPQPKQQKSKIPNPSLKKYIDPNMQKYIDADIDALKKNFNGIKRAISKAVTTLDGTDDGPKKS